MIIQKQSFQLSSLLSFVLKGKGGRIFMLFFLGLFLMPEAKAQVQVFTEQPVEFGAFVVGESGGIVTISHEGERIITGNIIPVDQSGQWAPLIFGIEAPLGAVVHIQNGPDVQLAGNNGGEMTLSLGESSHGTSFVSTVSPPERTYVSVSATLSVGIGENIPSGDYTGPLSIITFIQE